MTVGLHSWIFPVLHIWMEYVIVSPTLDSGVLVVFVTIRAGRAT